MNADAGLLSRQHDDDVDTPGTGVKLDRRAAWVAAGVLLWTAVETFFRFGYKYLDSLAREGNTPWLEPFLEEFTGGAVSYLIIMPLILALLHLPLTRSNWARRIPLYVLLLAAFSALKTLGMWGTRLLLFPAFGLGAYDYGLMSFRFPMEFFNDAGVFIMVAALTHLIHAYVASRDRELRTAKLEGMLKEAQLESLRGQLRPHFLFNTLNAISSYMYQDPHTADRMIGRLSAILRVSLDESSETIPLGRELEILDHYAEIVRLRFPDRVRLEIEADPALLWAPVPPLLLQPLVENAVQHGIAPRSEGGHIRVSARRQNQDLLIEVADDGPGFGRDAASTGGPGIGLANTADRLKRLYDDRHALDVGTAPEGGALVSIRLPIPVEAVA